MKSPEFLSDLVELALNDLMVVEQDPEYRVNMKNWHTYIDDETVCEVCLAGSVMAKSLKISQDISCTPSMFTNGWDEAMCSLDLVRVGRLEDALLRWGHSYKTCRNLALGIQPPPEYSEDPDGFKLYLKHVITQLRKNNA